MREALQKVSVRVLRCFSPTLCNPRTVTLQAPLPKGFSRQEYQSRFPFPSPGDLPNPGIEPMSLYVFCVGRSVLYHWHHLLNLSVFILFDFSLLKHSPFLSSLVLLSFYTSCSFWVLVNFPFVFRFFFFDVDHLKSLYGIYYILLLFYILAFWPQGVWDPSSLTGIEPTHLTLEGEVLTKDCQRSP